jgi:hypothetical protein
LDDQKIEELSAHMSDPPVVYETIIGQVRDIHDTPEAYKALMEELKVERKTFRGIAVTPNGHGIIRVYFY